MREHEWSIHGASARNQLKAGSPRAETGDAVVAIVKSTDVMIGK
jgi:molybdopterin-binding protein